MSLATAEPKRQEFLARFEGVWSSLRRYQVRQGLCWSFLTAALGLGALAAADFRLELPWSTRAAGLAAASALALGVFWVRVVAPLRWWTRPRTAVEIEARFPQLGQRIRTVVQYAGRSDAVIDSEGVAPSLVEALEEETEQRAQPLPLDQVVPWRRLWALAALAALPALVLIGLAVRKAEWRVALSRALLGDRPYTTLAVAPGNLRVDQGESVSIAVTVQGRPRRDVVLYTRPEGKPDAPWQALDLPASQREATLEKIKDPFAYRVVAGPASSPVYTIGVRYPLALKSFDVALTPPAYTGLKPAIVKGGDVQAIEGTAATFRLAFDAPPSEATMVVTDPTARPRDKKSPSGPEERVIPLVKVEKGGYTVALDLTHRLIYRIEAKTSDGRVLPKKRYRIDVREDRPPRVSFEQPDEALEVHPIAEVRHRIRIGDDFGLTKAGIAFRLNNGDEKTLIVKDFAATPEHRETAAALEEMLLLETLNAAPTDSLTYFAFAEDNYPGTPKRSETDLRYIDIRAFRREYKKAEPGPEGTGESTSLGELIARQRFNLNRGFRLARHRPADKSPTEDPLKIASFEETLATLTHEFGEGIEGIIGERVEPVHEAEEAMLAAVEALDKGRNATVPNHMEEALRHLIELRKALIVAIGDDPALAARLRQFDRTQAQKIRKNKKGEEDADALAERLEELAQEEAFVYATLAAGAAGAKNAEAKKGESGEPEEMTKADVEKGEKPAESPKGEPNKEGSPAEKGQNGPKGEQGPGKSPDKAKGQGGEPGESDDPDGAGGPKKNDRRDLMERQEKIADEARDLEAKLKALEAASDLAKARMAKAAEAAEKATGELARGNSKDATATAKGGAAMLHELARQVKGELAREVADELAMARDLADELAQREAELADMPAGAPGDQEGKDGPPGKGAKGEKPGKGDLTGAERLERLEEAARTLEEWLKGAAQRAEGKAAEQVREVMEQGDAGQIVERTERVGELILGGQKPAAQREARELSKSFEILAQQLDALHRGIVAPELAALAELDRRLAELTEKLKTLETNAEITDWHREAAALVRDLGKAGLAGAAEALEAMLTAGGWNGGAGDWHWLRDAFRNRVAPTAYSTALRNVTVQVQEKIQDLLLKDMASARDEATPPEFKELVERYYEVLSRDKGEK